MPSRDPHASLLDAWPVHPHDLGGEPGRAMNIREIETQLDILEGDRLDFDELFSA